MVVCMHCGKEITEERTSCPSCGTSLSENQIRGMSGPTPIAQKNTKTFPFDSLYEEYIPEVAPLYERNYAARPIKSVDTSSQKASTGEQEKAPAAAPGDDEPTPTPTPAHMTFTERFFHANTNAPLIVEVVLSLFTGIFGVGWLLIGKKRTGTVLLAMSLIFYLPLLILSYGLAYFSYGLSILCTGPFTVAAVLLNAFILYKTMQRLRASSAQFNVPNEI